LTVLTNEQMYGCREIHDRILDHCPMKNPGRPVQGESPWVFRYLNELICEFSVIVDGMPRFKGRFQSGWYGWRFKLEGCPMKRPAGRPLKYGGLLAALPQMEIFTPAGIADFAESNDLIADQDQCQVRQAKQRIRVAMALFARSRGFHNEGDGLVSRTGLATIPGWYGWRWSLAVFY
jgi:hypothetical protein